MSIPVAPFFLRHDAGRIPSQLSLRYARMQADALAFFRGSAPLWYAHFANENSLHKSPSAWLCGDAHVENFGSYTGDNGLVYFDLNDFDEAVRGPVLWDVSRLAVSVLLAAAQAGLKQAEQQTITRELLRVYADTLATGKPYLLERATAKGVVRRLLQQAAHRRRRTLLSEHASHRHGWHLRLHNSLLALADGDRATLTTAFDSWGLAQQAPPSGPALDIAQRAVGIGSLGFPHYAVLAEQIERPPKRPLLLDLKLARPAAAQSYAPQPIWASEAQRVVQVQTWLQAVPPAQLQAVSLRTQPLVLRAWQPTADKLNFATIAQHPAAFQRVVPVFARLLAWAHLRAAGRQGAADPDTLQAFGQDSWLSGLLNFATEAAAQVNADYQEFSLACQAGELPV